MAHDRPAAHDQPAAQPAATNARPGDLLVLLSGPNLVLLGERHPEIYGTETLASHVRKAAATASRYGLALEHVESASEAELVGAVHGARGRAAAIVVNAGALTHYSWSLADALAAYDGHVVELHLSNPVSREPWRHTSVVSPVAAGTISGFGALGYEMAVEAAARLLGRADGHR